MPSTTFYNLKYSKQQELFHSAMTLFAENQYDDLSVRFISKEMNITTGAFYRYFGSKEEFYIFMVDYTLEQFWKRRSQMEKESGHPVSIEQVLAQDQLQSDFWKFFYLSSLDIRMKYYFRTRENPLYKCKLEDVSGFKKAEMYSQEEKEVTAFAISVMQYVVSSFKHLEHREYDDEELFQTLSKMLRRGFEQGKDEKEVPFVDQKPPVLCDFEE